MVAFIAPESRLLLAKRTPARLVWSRSPAPAIEAAGGSVAAHAGAEVIEAPEILQIRPREQRFT